MWSRARPALSMLCPPPQPGACPLQPGVSAYKPVPAEAAWCLPTHPSAQGPLDEGELLGHQQDPVEALNQLQLPDAPFGGEQSAGQRRWSCHHPHTPGSSELPLTQSPPGPPRFPACLPHQSPLGQEGTTEHCPSEPLGLAQGWMDPRPDVSSGPQPWCFQPTWGQRAVPLGCR